MGDISRNMKIVIVALAIAALAIASASPVDTVVPEEVDTNLAQTESSQGNLQDILVQEAEYSEAQQRVKALQAEGKDDKACRDLAKADKNSISVSVLAMQKILNGLDQGSGCKDEGQAVVKATGKEKDTTADDLKTKQKAKSDLANKKVVFEPTLKSMTGSCAVAKTDKKYIAAKNKYDKASNAVTSAEGALTVATTAHENAIEAANKARKACECNVQEKHASTWKTANKDNAANQKAWNRATHMLCVLDGKPWKNCAVETAPKVKQPTLDAAVKNAKCPAA